MLHGTSKEYLPPEAVQPLAEANRMLRSMEDQLIFALNPVINKHGKSRDNSTTSLASIHIQNSVSKFFNDKVIFASLKPKCGSRKRS